MRTLFHSLTHRAYVSALLGLMLGYQSSWACTTLPPTLHQQYKDTERVYMARLVSLKSTPLRAQLPAVGDGAIEEATFEVFFVLKGPKPKDGEIKTRTEWWPGNCALSIRRPPMEVIGKDGEVVQNAYADVWILFLTGKQPFELRDTVASRPINLFNEAELGFLLQESQSGTRPNPSLERTRGR